MNIIQILNKNKKEKTLKKYVGKRLCLESS